MQLHAATQRSLEPDAESRLAKLLARLSTVIDERRRTVQGFHSGLNHELLETRLAHDAEALRGDREIEIHVIVDGEGLPLNPAVADEVYYIACEALANALKHAHATRKDVADDYAESELRATVVDNGVGMTSLSTSADGHLGVSGMHQRAESIGATLRLSSKSSSGTTVALIVPRLWHTQQCNSGKSSSPHQGYS